MKTVREIGLALLVAVSLALAVTPMLGRVSPFLDAFASFLPLSLLFAVPAILWAVLTRRWRSAAGAALAIVLALATMVPEWVKADGAEPVENGRPRLVIVSHNLLRRNADPSATLDALRNSGADILLLQEARGEIGRRLSELYTNFPYHGACAGQCDLAILSRVPISRPRWRLRDSQGKPFGPALLWTKVKGGAFGGLMVVTVHFPWPIPPQAQGRTRAMLVDALGRMDRRGIFLAGDFNLTPWSRAMHELDAGLAPMQRHTHGLASFPARIQGKPFPVPVLPIDQVFAGPGWQVESIRRLDRTGSDHYPLRIVLTPVVEASHK